MGYDPDKLPKDLKSKYHIYVHEVISGYSSKRYFNLNLFDFF